MRGGPRGGRVLEVRGSVDSQQAEALLLLAGTSGGWGPPSDDSSFGAGW